MVNLLVNDNPVEVKWWTFPAGERCCRIDECLPLAASDEVIVDLSFKGSDDLVDMMLLVNAVRQIHPLVSIDLKVPYFPFARQDRMMTLGEPHALQVVVQMIKACKFRLVLTMDVHSDVVAGMFDPGTVGNVTQEMLWGPVMKSQFKDKEAYLVSPDAGALKKIYKLAKYTGLPVIEAGKVRDVSTGEIVKTQIQQRDVSEDATFIVVDDICDGGRTFIELAKAIREEYPAIGKLILCVSHGIFSKGLEVLDCFDQIHTINNMSGLDLEAFNNRKEAV